MNDFASIIAHERLASLDAVSLALLEEKRPGIDQTGAPKLESYYQPLLSRLQFVYRLLTGKTLDRSSREWQHLVALKNARDAYVHRVGKPSGQEGILSDDFVIVKGFSAVRNVLAEVLTSTPEFAAKFVYKFLAFWSCGSESPFIWDGSEGNSFYLGLGNFSSEKVAGLFAALPGSFSTRGVRVASATKRRR